MSILRTQSVAPSAGDGAPAPQPPTLRSIRDAVRGRASEVPRSAAVELLAASDYPNKHRDLERLLADESALPRLRYLAAMALPRADHRAAEEILIAATRCGEPRVLTGVMRALGQIGGKEALEAVVRALPSAEGTARAQAEFAAMLISHRLGVDGYDAPEPGAKAVVEMPADCGRRVRVRPALSTEVERSLVSLGTRPYGIEVAEQPMYEFRCDRCAGMVMLNRAWTGRGALDGLRKQKALFALGALRDDSTGAYSAAAVFLTKPMARGKRIRISIHLTNGDQIFAGEASTKGEVAQWSLHAVRRLGAFPIRAEGEFEGGRLRIALAESGTRILEQAAPEPLDRAALRRSLVAPPQAAKG